MQHEASVTHHMEACLVSATVQVILYQALGHEYFEGQLRKALSSMAVVVTTECSSPAGQEVTDQREQALIHFLTRILRSKDITLQ